MKSKFLDTLFKDDPHFLALAEEISGNKRDLEVFASSRLCPIIIAALFSRTKRPILVITENQEKTQRWANDLKNFLPDEAFFLPDWEILPHERIAPGKEISSERLRILYYFKIKRPIIAVSSIQTVLRKIPGKESPLLEPVKLSLEDHINLYELLEKLISMGYERVYQVSDRGQLSARGGIVDIFAADADLPVRLEFFGDQLESLRTFSISDQRSIDQINSFEIFACREIQVDQNKARQLAETLKKSPIQTEEIEKDIEKLEKQQYFAGIERYIPFLYQNLATILDLVPQTSIVVFDDRNSVREEANRFVKQQEGYLSEAVIRGEIIDPPTSYFWSFQDLRMDWIALDLSSQIPGSAADGQRVRMQSAHQFKSESIQPILGKLERLRKLLLKLLKAKYFILLLLNDQGQAERLQEILFDWGIDSFFATQSFTPSSGSVQLTVGDLSSGFILDDKKIALLSHSDIFLKSHRERRTASYAAPTSSAGYPIKSFADLRRGDYVVHVNHGIAVYQGITSKEVQDIVRDYLILQYAKGDKLFLPIDQAERVTKYIGADANAPKINRLTGNEWLRVKKKVKRSLKELAVDLYSFYEERANATGIAFSSDTIWQAELEEAFPYEETKSQLEATADLKRDMERAKPMDRLICGDVGYGKTEVAMRATFKTVMEEKQVMILVPTTILAEQHFKTFKTRFAPYPIIVEELSRFKSSQKQAEIVKKFQDGKVDVLIGTHRLLQKDILPKNLGLLVIDEEQRFGVGHKEHLKTLKKNVDALALTATPIPRTLQMSLSGIRDISIMDTPPENRYPISTYVGEFNQEIIRNAIRREISRGGQVYCVHNRVESINKMARFLEQLVPQARFAVAHGQMSERPLEKVMNEFLDHKHDVLVCTSIIESGIDISTVNTLIVDRSERLGLSTLYQLRGRVGRAHHQAYAYFFFSPQANLTSAASERLKTISEFTGLGSGLKIALRDLEIRGAGNLLGPEQHGQMSSVGFELYCQMLNQAVQEIKGKLPEKIEVRIELPISAYIPHDYIEDEVLRTEAYQKMSAVVSVQGVDEVTNELQDRYGPLSQPVGNLLKILRIRVLTQQKRITNISWERKRLILYPIALDPKELDHLKAAGWKSLYHRKEKMLKVYNLELATILSFLFKLFNDIIP